MIMIWYVYQPQNGLKKQSYDNQNYMKNWICFTTITYITVSGIAIVSEISQSSLPATDMEKKQ